MPITIEHHPGIEEIGRASYASGKGRYEKWLRQMELGERKQGAAEEAQKFAEMVTGQKLADVPQARKESREHDIERMLLGADLQEQQMEQAAQIDEAKREAQMLRELKKAGISYSDKQMRDRQAIQDRMDWVQRQEDWTPEEKADALRQLKAQLNGIQPLPRPEQGSPFPEGQDIGQTWTDKTGALLTRDNEGNVKKLADPPKPIPEKDKPFRYGMTRDKYFDALLKMREAMGVEKEVGEGKVITEYPPWEKVEEELRKRMYGSPDARGSIPEGISHSWTDNTLYTEDDPTLKGKKPAPAKKINFDKLPPAEQQKVVAELEQAEQVLINIENQLGRDSKEYQTALDHLKTLYEQFTRDKKTQTEDVEPPELSPMAPEQLQEMIKSGYTFPSQMR